MASENSINYALRIIKPILDGSASVADLKPEAERQYVDKVQDALSKTVFASGCMSWYVRARPGGKTWNASTYPWTQPYYWWRSLFPVWSDWQYSVSVTPNRRLREPTLTPFLKGSEKAYQGFPATQGTCCKLLLACALHSLAHQGAREERCPGRLESGNHDCFSSPSGLEGPSPVQIMVL